MITLRRIFFCLWEYESDMAVGVCVVTMTREREVKSGSSEVAFQDLCVQTSVQDACHEWREMSTTEGVFASCKCIRRPESPFYDGYAGIASV
jgi:hypothetical protein